MNKLQIRRHVSKVDGKNMAIYVLDEMVAIIPLHRVESLIDADRLAINQLKEWMLNIRGISSRRENMIIFHWMAKAIEEHLEIVDGKIFNDY